MEYPKFKVCVRCFTFNHSKYITDAMNGFTMQQTSFPFVCCIVDDASTDGEQDVVRKYVNENFDFSEGSVAYHKETDYAHITYAQNKTNKNCYFAVLYLKENHYSQRKPKMGYLSEWRDMCEYEAFCEGDDYWFVSDKLEKQVKLLDENECIGLCYTNFDILYQNSGRFVHNLANTNPTKYPMVYSSLECFIMSCGYVCPPSWVYRIRIMDDYEQIEDACDGTYCIFSHFMSRSNVKYINYTTSVYRVLSNSASHSTNAEVQIKRARDLYNLQLALLKKYGYYNEDKDYCKHLFLKSNIILFSENHLSADISNCLAELSDLSIKEKVVLYLGKSIFGSKVLKHLHRLWYVVKGY